MTLTLSFRIHAFPFARAALTAVMLMATLTASAAEEPVRFGTSGGLSNESIAISVAIDQGYFKEVGIEPEIIHFKGGAPAIQALAGGAIEYCICAPEHVIRLRNRGVDAIVAAPLDNRMGYALFGPKDGSAKSLAELKGQKLGITSPGSKTDNLLRLALHRADLDPDADVQIVGIGGPANQISAIDTGNIAAGMLSGFEALRAEQTHSVVYDWRTLRVPSLGLLALGGWAKEKPDVAKAVASATRRGAELAATDRTIRVKTLRELFPEADEALIELAADKLNDSTVTSPRFAVEEFDALQKDILELEPELKPISFDEFNPAPVTQ
ncbi:ABC transporter substrate-binding protein [Mesorhizobium sp. 1B3]|uniref:ABC transporter substrate-binding protein n=1 Tax=Mesorhizobium sp. 1B3 TaxID=3243599 RepID=UPI003D97B222